MMYTTPKNLTNNPMTVGKLLEILQTQPLEKPVHYEIDEWVMGCGLRYLNIDDEGDCLVVNARHNDL